MKICLLGDSHLAAIKTGASGLKTTHKLDFFGSPRDSLSGLRLQNTTLAPGSANLAEMLKVTSGGQTRIELADYDQFILVGLGFSFTRLARMHQRYRLSSGVSELKHRYLISEDCRELAIAGLYERSLALNLAGAIRVASQAPIILVPEPFRSINVLGSTQEVELWNYMSDRTDDLLTIYRAMQKRCEALLPNFRILEQPADTTDGVFTRSEFAEAAPRMTAKGFESYTAPDFGHMGPLYGNRVLTEVFQSLKRPASSGRPKRRPRKSDG